MVNFYWFLIGTTTLNYALKKKKQPIEENCAWNSEFCSPNLTKQKKEV